MRKKKKSDPSTQISHLLESETLDDLLHSKDLTNKLLKYHWDYYYDLARQRNAISDKIYQCINKTSKSYQFERWQRAVKYKYGLHPLCVTGSMKDIGGRFNMGNDINIEIKGFPCLYIAHDKDTA